MNAPSSRLRPLVLVFLVALPAAALLAFAGCSDDDDDSPVVPPVDAPTVYHSEAELMTGFRQALWGMDIERYRDVLDESFTFRFLPQDVVYLELASDLLTREQEEQIMARMFAHDVGAGGHTVTSIDFPRLDIQTLGVRLPSSDADHPGALMTDYQVEITFFYTNTDGDAASFTVRTLNRFYSIDTPSAADADVMEWRLCGWDEIGVDYKRANEEATVGMVKALF